MELKTPELKKSAGRIGLILACFFASGLAAQAADLSPQEIIQRFAAKETEFMQARQSYTYKTRMIAQVLDDYDTVKEQRQLLIETYFTTDGKRHQRTLQDEGELYSVALTQEDIDDATSIQPFVLTREDLPSYQVEYQGKERVDELNTYVFSVKPRRVEKGKRYFEGKIWVDDIDLQIVKTDGRALPQTRENKFPKFETIRQMVDKKYWFPVWTMADEHLRFGGGGGWSPQIGMPLPLPGGGIPGRRRAGNAVHEVHVREIITYEDYKKFEVKTDIKFGAPTQ